MQIRPAQVGDAAVVQSLIRAAWKDRFPPESNGNWITVPDVAVLLEEGGGFVLEDGRDAIGSVLWSPADWCVELMKLALRPDRAGAGLGPLLIDAVERHGRRLGVPEVRLAVRADAPGLVRFYERHGYVVDPSLAYSHANPRSAPPFVLRKPL